MKMKNPFENYPDTVFIIRKIGGECLVHFSFKESDADPSLIAAFLDAIEQAGSAVLGIEGTFTSIDRGGIKILFAHANHTFLAVIAPEETSKLHRHMEKLMTKFEETYCSSLENWTGIMNEFHPFKLEILQEFNTINLPLHIIPKQSMLNAHALLEQYQGATKGIYKEMLLILNLIDNSRSLDLIIELSELPSNIVHAIIQFWIRTGMVTVQTEDIHVFSDTQLPISNDSANPEDFMMKMNELGIKENQLYGLVQVPSFEGDPFEFPPLERRFLNLCTGEKSLAAIALILGMSYFEAHQVASSLKSKGLKMNKKLITKPQRYTSL